MSETMRANGKAGTGGGLDMPGWLATLGGLVERSAGFWQGLGKLEGRVFAHELEGVRIERPIYVTGLARSGTTIVLELLAGHASVATHRYRDFPVILAPMFWNRAFAHVYKEGAPPAERAHKDRILVTPDSPEAMEEVIWMRFFASAHETGVSQVLDRATSNPAFERFYKEHVRKILLVRGGRPGQARTRYLAKGNYNLTRLEYLLKLLPDARFVVPVRGPRWHVASLIKQHRLFSAEEERDPRILAHMNRAGHMEFGHGRRAIDLGDGRAAAIEALWRDGQEVRGWARYWAMLMGFLADRLAASPALAAATRIVPYEDLCREPRAELAALARHVGLDFTPARLDAMAARLSLPTYYEPGFSTAEEAVIAEETGAAAGRLGYA